MAGSKAQELIIKIAGKVEKSFGSAIHSVGSKLSSITKAVSAATAAAAAASAAAVTAIGVAAMNVGKEFERSMSQVAATMMIDKTTKEGQEAFETLENAAREQGAKTAFSATEAAQALNYLALAGYKAQEAADALPIVLKLAGAGAMDLATASDMVTDSMSALGIKATEKNLTTFADQLAKTASKANTSVSQLGEAILTVGGTAKGLAGGTIELNTSLGILADSGIKAAEGGTHLRNMILSLQNPRNKDAANLFKQLSLSAYDTEGNMRSLGDVFGDLNEAMSGMSAKKVNHMLATIFKQTDLAAARAMLAATTDSIESLETVMNAELEESGTSISALGINLQELANSFDMAATQEQFASQMLDKFGLTTEQSAKLYSGLQSVLEGTGNRFDELSAFVEDSVGACQKMYEIQQDNLEGDISILKSSLSDLGISISKDLNGPIRKMTQLAASMVGQLGDAYKESGMEGMVEAIGGCLSEVVDVIADYAPKITTMGIHLLQNFISGIINNSSKISKAAADVIAVFINGIFLLLPQVIFAGVDIILKFAQSMTTQLPQLITNGTQAIVNFVKGIFQRLPDILITALILVETLGKSLEDNAPMLITSAIQLVGMLILGITQMLPNLLSMGIQLLLSVMQGIISNFPLILQVAVQVVFHLIQGIVQMFPMIIECGIQLIFSLIQGIISNLGNIMQAAVELILVFITGLVLSIPKLIDTALMLVDSIIETIFGTDWLEVGMQIIKGIINGFLHMGKSLWDIVKKYFSGEAPDLSTQGNETAASYAQGITENADAVNGAASTLSNHAFAAIDVTSAATAGTAAGAAFTTGVTNGISDVSFDFSSLGLDTNQMFTNIDVTSAATAGTAAGAAFTTGITTELSDFSFDFSSLGLNTNALETNQMFTNVDITSASAAGVAVGAAFTTGITNSISDVSLDFSSLGLNKNELKTNQMFTNIDITSATNAGTAAGAAFTTGVTNSISDFSFDFSSLGLNTESLETTMSVAGMDSANALSAGINNNSIAVTNAMATLGTEATEALDNSWNIAEQNTQSAMTRITEIIKTAAQVATNAIKSAFEQMTITIPKPKIPVIHVNHDLVTYGQGGSVSIPNFSVSWNARGGIFTKPTILGSSAGMQGIEEAGAEAILPLDTLWIQMKSIMKEVLAEPNQGFLNRNQEQTNTILTLTNKIETMMQGTKETSIGNFVDPLTNYKGNQPQPVLAREAPITYAPVYHFHDSSPSKETLIEAEKMSQREFEKMIAKHQRNINRKRF